ncbi:MAG: DNA repair protein RadA, partial [Chthonomonadales bacterium]
MAKTHTRFVCQSCGHESPRWVGKCTECDAWNSFQEEVRMPEKPAAAALGRGAVNTSSSRPIPITQVTAQTHARLSSGISELDRVLGGGIVPGGVVLVGGDPGIGKSTLLTQVAHAISSRSNPGGEPTSVLYVSGEESVQQIKLRSERVGAGSDHLYLLNETEISSIIHQIAALSPGLVVIDSIQTTYDSALDSAPGNVSQIRNCASMLAQVAKGGGPPIFLIGHVTKEGSLAGPRVLEHMVDTVLYFEGDRSHAYRIVRSVKNRFGSTDEIGIFEMREEGLVEVENPSAALLAERSQHQTGSAVTATIEGSRPLLVEVQALVARSFLANPRRTATGFELNRLNMLLAVLEKRVGLRLGDQDVYVNVAGGLKVTDPAVDLAVIMAIASNFREQPVDPDAVILGEVGLGGEIRSTPRLELRVREAARLGFTKVITSSRHKMKGSLGAEVISAGNVVDAIRYGLQPPISGS